MGKAITPPDTAWIDVGGYIDDAGHRIAALRFGEPDEEWVTIRFVPAFMAALGRHLVKAAEAMEDEAFWADAAKLADRDRRFT